MSERSETRAYIIKGNDQDIVCGIFRKDCKRLRIVITSDIKVKVIAPLRADDRFIEEAVKKKTSWIIRAIDKLKKCHFLPVPEKYAAGERLAYLGNEFVLMVVPGKREPARVSGNSLIVRTPRPDGDSVKRVVDKWYRLRAEEIFSRCLKEGFSIVSQYDVLEPFLKIRRMKRRWGSCTSSGKITLNLRLIHLPLNCIEYIVMHELCHLKQPNHSKYFYAFLQECMPDWRARKDVLDNYRLEF